jgi:hypothetical protein
MAMSGDRYTYIGASYDSPTRLETKHGEGKVWKLSQEEFNFNKLQNVATLSVKILVRHNLAFNLREWQQ